VKASKHVERLLEFRFSSGRSIRGLLESLNDGIEFAAAVRRVMKRVEKLEKRVKELEQGLVPADTNQINPNRWTNPPPGPELLEVIGPGLVELEES